MPPGGLSRVSQWLRPARVIERLTSPAFTEVTRCAPTNTPRTQVGCLRSVRPPKRDTQAAPSVPHRWTERLSFSQSGHMRVPQQADAWRLVDGRGPIPTSDLSGSDCRSAQLAGTEAWRQARRQGRRPASSQSPLSQAEAGVQRQDRACALGGPPRHGPRPPCRPVD